MKRSLSEIPPPIALGLRLNGWEGVMGITRNNGLVGYLGRKEQGYQD
jgi:hypothetical protein